MFPTDPLPTIASVEKANGPFSVLVLWATGNREGRTDVIDVAPQIFTFKVYRRLRDDPALFSQVAVSHDGSAIVWPGSDDLEVSADALEDLVDQSMTNDAFSQFMRDMKWSYDTTAVQLGLSRRQVAYYAKEREIPRLVFLACEALRARAEFDETIASTTTSTRTSLPANGNASPLKLMR